MIQHRLGRLRVLGLPTCLICSVCLLIGQAASAQNPPQSSPQQTPPSQQPNQQKPPQQQNPFENVPQTPEKPTQPSNIQEAKPATIGENIIEAVDFRGQHRVPQDTLRALIYTKKGDVYDE